MRLDVQVIFFGLHITSVFMLVSGIMKTDFQPAHVTVTTDHRGLHLQVTTPTQVHSLPLVRAPRVLSREIDVISLGQEGGRSSQVVDTSYVVDPSIHLLDGNFFENREKGSILSIHERSDGGYHVEGHLDHVTVIAPPGSAARHRRTARRHDGHFIFSVDSDDDVYTANIALKKRKYKKKDNRLTRYGKQREIDSSEIPEDEDEIDIDDDYLQVPDMFDNEDKWRAHQARAEEEENEITDKEVERDDHQFTKHRDGFGGRQQTTHMQMTTHGKQTTNGQTGPINEDMVAALLSILKAQYDVNSKYSNSNRRTISKGRNNKKGTILSKRKYKKQRHRRTVFRLKSRSTAGVSKKEGNFRFKRQAFMDSALEKSLPFGSSDNTVFGSRDDGDFTAEVMVIVDSQTYRDFDYDWQTLQLFILHFWQSVNARFLAITDMDIKLKLTSIVKIMFPGFQPFIENNRLTAGSRRLDVHRVLEDLAGYAQGRLAGRRGQDLVMLMTGEDLCKKKMDGSYTKSSRGIAYVRGACISTQRFHNQTYNIGVAEVGRSFRGVLTATHEVGHLLGAFHDGDQDASNCPSTSGFIMSRVWRDPQRFNTFSGCSQENIKRFLQDTWYSDCLLTSNSDEIKKRYSFPKTLPGQTFLLEDQCKHYVIGGIPCQGVSLQDQCGRLCCEKWSRPFQSKEPAADGTWCGRGKMCYSGGCVPQNQILN